MGASTRSVRWLDPSRWGGGDIGGMMTTCRREGDVWILNGQRQGSAARFALNVIWRAKKPQ